MAKRMIIAILNLVLGVVLGGSLLEALLQVNSGLLLRGMAVPAPVDSPLTISEYDIFSSDADVFYWHSNLIRPVSKTEDVREAHVRFKTDEFGFPNPAPLPAEADVIVLGRSYSLGAQAEEAWPFKLASQKAIRVINLSQTGSGIETKILYMHRFGWLRQPRWIIMEVLPSMDILGYSPLQVGLLNQLPVPIIRAFWNPPAVAVDPVAKPMYPLMIDIPGDQASLTFFSLYLSALTADRETISTSRQWLAYTERLLALAENAQSHSACILLLYVPTKENIYISLATSSEQLEPLLPLIQPWAVDAAGNLFQEASGKVTISSLQASVHAARDLILDFAQQHQLVVIDPTEHLTESVLNGLSPYMRYDTHWNDIGHSLVAELVAEKLSQTPCP